MKIRSILFASAVLLISLDQVFCQSEDPDKRILINVAGRNVEEGEFIRMYNKSQEPGKKNDPDVYLEQFIDFKLKVADAIAAGFDTTKAFRDELNGYRNQLAQSYLTDPDIKEKMLRKAYDRSLTEVNASHILVACPPNASPADTLKAYRKAMGIRERILMGEPFEQVARASSDDKSVLINGGNLGYFTVFQMITPFEEAAYTIKPNTLSMPVRTPFGYHIIRVNDRRPSRGKIKVAHIMKAAPPGSDENRIRMAKESIDSIYQKLLDGASFRELASKYSDHRESAVKGGELDWFGAGEIISDFAEAAFALKDSGDISKPVRTPYGYHIIMLLGKRAPDTYEDARPFLESKINQSYLNSLGKISFISKLKREYNYSVNKPVREWFIKNTDSLIIRGKSGYDRSKIPSGDIFSFADQHLTAAGFEDILEKRGNRVITDDPAVYIDRSIESISSEQIIRYENANLENKYPDFRYLMKEFHDGILLFDISSDKVWNKVQEDSTGIMAFYSSHKGNYLSKRGIEGKMYTLKEKGDYRKLASLLRRFKSSPDRDSKIVRKFTVNGDTLVTIRPGRWYRGDDPAVDSIQWKIGPHKFTDTGFPAVLYINEILEPHPLSLSEIRGDVISDYQDWLMDEWVKQLREKYTVTIDKTVLEDVKKRINNE